MLERQTTRANFALVWKQRWVTMNATAKVKHLAVLTPKRCSESTGLRRCHLGIVFNSVVYSCTRCKPDAAQ